eukprot:UN01634
MQKIAILVLALIAVFATTYVVAMPVDLRDGIEYPVAEQLQIDQQEQEQFLQYSEDNIPVGHIFAVEDYPETEDVLEAAQRLESSAPSLQYSEDNIPAGHIFAVEDEPQELPYDPELDLLYGDEQQQQELPYDAELDVLYGRQLSVDPIVEVNPKFYKISSSNDNANAFSFVFTVKSNMALPFFTLSLPRHDHIKFVGNFDKCTVDGVETPAILEIDQIENDHISTLSFEAPLTANNAAEVKCSEAYIVQIKGAESVPVHITMQTRFATHNGGYYDFETTTEPVNDKFPQYAWYIIFGGSVCLALVVAATAVALVIRAKRKQSPKEENMQKLEQQDLEKSKPEEKQSLLAAAPDSYVSIV